MYATILIILSHCLSKCFMAIFSLKVFGTDKIEQPEKREAHLLWPSQMGWELNMNETLMPNNVFAIFTM